SPEKDGEYYIIAGERRFRAVKLNGTKTIRAIVKKTLKPEEIGYVQMAENIKRANLTVVEIAEFICRQLEAGDKQAEVVEKLGLNKAIVSQYAVWPELPECIKKALTSKKIGSIQSAYALFKTWQEYPEETAKFVAENEKISQAEARKFEPKSLYVQTFQDREDISQPSDQVSDEPVLDTSVSPATEDIVASEESENKPEEADNGSEETETVNSEEGLKEEIGTPEECGSIDNYEEKTTTDEEERLDVSEELETAADDFLQEQSEESTYKKPVILCLIEGRECELLYKKKTLDGFVVVKYEDGTEEEVPAEDVTLNRIIEA
ncbi:ParB/RepB/Spo0J family partition protein, partial [uncultured Parasutterella sp.]